MTEMLLCVSVYVFVLLNTFLYSTPTVMSMSIFLASGLAY